MNILVTLDSNYRDQLVVMLYSLLKSNKKTFFNVYVMNSSLTEDDFEYFSVHLNRDRLKIIDIKIDDSMFSGAHITDRYPREMYYRIFAAKYLPKDVDKIIYLDPDLVVINSL
jgi:lipopolysaccharide biosynthesis glycosyltransferase